MEGLLPLVYKAIKKTKNRRQYQCLSSGAALSYNISMAEIYPQTNQDHVLHNHTPTHNMPHHHHHQQHNHRRYNSLGDFPSGAFQSPQMRTRVDSPSNKQLVRFRSHRMFSCITGI